jgi:hypothetical protein
MQWQTMAADDDEVLTIASNVSSAGHLAQMPVANRFVGGGFYRDSSSLFVEKNVLIDFSKAASYQVARAPGDGVSLEEHYSTESSTKRSKASLEGGVRREIGDGAHVLGASVKRSFGD